MFFKKMIKKGKTTIGGWRVDYIYWGRSIYLFLKLHIQSHNFQGHIRIIWLLLYEKNTL